MDTCPPFCHLQYGAGSGKLGWCLRMKLGLQRFLSLPEVWSGFHTRSIFLPPTQDIVDQVCRCLEPPVPPVARIFFAICDTRTGFCLNPYQTLTPSEARRQYQLRLFVNTGHNSFQLQKMSKNAHDIYYQQVRVAMVTGLTIYCVILCHDMAMYHKIRLVSESTIQIEKVLVTY